ncbi:MAG TPA: acyl-CoA dehydrogenase family protein, partial [Actinomycetota bacterium]|nr:acyl-CoA dehydrogenase family protein [Actinomycetota bacterium]
MIDFDLTEEQRALRGVARDLFAKRCPPSLIRARWNGTRDEKLWRALAKVGLLGIMIPTQFGGAGGDETDAVLVLEEAGRAALPEPFAET